MLCSVGLLSKFPGELLKKAALYHAAEHALTCVGRDYNDWPEIANRIPLHIFLKAVDASSWVLATSLVLLGSTPTKYLKVSLPTGWLLNKNDTRLTNPIIIDRLWGWKKGGVMSDSRSSIVYAEGKKLAKTLA